MTRRDWTPARITAAAFAAMLVVLDLAGQLWHEPSPLDFARGALSASRRAGSSQAHPESWWHAMPSFDLLYGVAGCIAIVIVSKLLGSAWLQRRERYYERET